ncbi:4-(cytidine 5'-diphospho)-2-C-methyl-D-erythritol kinase [bacterium DOLJORAL78_65_58]|nr:MAG: 4-(cytidine 5'-diphospho)-2-C-methyl-D-erythritol kinase [bacterium DOLZORAL124_64_63]PIE76409.1 MAG: 4-(cytidine 5'-diphospho)-2-C-methyl-D-erythritol kinase [bacterium DOLJORAL78_65_58]
MKDAGFIKGRKPVNQTVKLRAPAKVNLHLEVVRQRHDGYHEIETIFQAVQLFDHLSISLLDRFPGGEPEIGLTVTPAGAAPDDHSNLCWEAARHFCRETGVSGEISIHLEKSIPTEAGLGGGSSDAAAVLIACNHLFGTGLEPAKLEKLGASLGADVPFFIRGGTALGRGIGSILTPLPPVATGRFLIVKPPIKLRTASVYANLNMGLTVNSAAANIRVMKPMLVRFPQRTWPGFNRLESAVLPQQPLLQRLVHRLQEVAPVAMLSGSGSAVFGVFPESRDLDDLVTEFEDGGNEVHLVGPHALGAEIR